MSDERTFKNYIYRVGGFFCVVLVSILIAKYYFPGYEAYASIFACTLGIIYLLIEYVKKQNKTKN